MISVALLPAYEQELYSNYIAVRTDLTMIIHTFTTAKSELSPVFTAVESYNFNHAIQNHLPIKGMVNIN